MTREGIAQATPKRVIALAQLLVALRVGSGARGARRAKDDVADAADADVAGGRGALAHGGAAEFVVEGEDGAVSGGVPVAPAADARVEALGGGGGGRDVGVVWGELGGGEGVACAAATAVGVGIGVYGGVGLRDGVRAGHCICG